MRLSEQATQAMQMLASGLIEENADMRFFAQEHLARVPPLPRNDIRLRYLSYAAAFVLALAASAGLGAIAW